MLQSLKLQGTIMTRTGQESLLINKYKPTPNVQGSSIPLNLFWFVDCFCKQIIVLRCLFLS